MIERRSISTEQAREAMSSGDFGPEITAAGPRVAVILTQSWCPQWPAMEKWMRALIREDKPAEHDIIIFEFVYDKSDISKEFTRFKEQTLGNALIPYVRYYREGNLMDQSNYVGSRDFLEKFA